MAIPIPISVGSLFKLVKLSGKIVYNTAVITHDGMLSLKSPESLQLAERSSEIVEDL